MKTELACQCDMMELITYSKYCEKQTMLKTVLGHHEL